MTSFAYTAINAQGLEARGVLHAADESAAKDQLRQRGLLARSLSEQKAASNRVASFSKIKSKSLQVFSRQFATLIQAGVSIVASLLILEEQTEDKKLSTVIAEVREDVESGVVLSRALARHPKVFNRLYVAMIEAGEESGTLDIVLDRIAVQIEKETMIKRRVKSAMLYPLCRADVRDARPHRDADVPRPDLRGDLRGPERPAADVDADGRGRVERPARLLVHHLPVVGLVAFALMRYKRTPQGQANWDRLKLRAPMKIGDVVLKVSMARFSRTLATLVSAGVDIVKALEITGSTAGNTVIEESLVEVRRRVHEGARIAQTLVEQPVFPPWSARW